MASQTHLKKMVNLSYWLSQLNVPIIKKSVNSHTPDLLISLQIMWALPLNALNILQTIRVVVIAVHSFFKSIFLRGEYLILRKNLLNILTYEQMLYEFLKHKTTYVWPYTIDVPSIPFKGVSSIASSR